MDYGFDEKNGIENLKTLIKEKGFSLSVIADELYPKSRQAYQKIHRIFNKNNDLSVRDLFKIAEIIREKPSNLLRALASETNEEFKTTVMRGVLYYSNHGIMSTVFYSEDTGLLHYYASNEENEQITGVLEFPVNVHSMKEAIDYLEIFCHEVSVTHEVAERNRANQNRTSL